MRDRWEIRINNIRSNGDTFRSFSDARAALLRRVNSHVVDLQRRDHAAKDQAGRAETRFAQETLKASKERPIPNSCILIMPGQTPMTDHREFVINRLPWCATGGRLKVSFKGA